MRHGVLAEPADLAKHPPSGAQLRSVLVVLGVLAGLFALLAPLARTPLPAAPEFVPMYQSMLIGSNLLTGILLLGHVQTSRSWSLGILTLGYLFTALIALAHMLTYPGLFSAHGVLGGNNQTTPWLFIVWHALFPLFVIGYARSYRRPLPAHFIRVGALLTCLFVAALVLACTSGAPYLPALVRDYRFLPVYRWISAIVLALSLYALWTTAHKRPRAVLDVWLTIAMSAWIFEVMLSCLLNTGRYDLGFYAGRLYGLAASLFVLGAVAIDNIALHARLRDTFEEMIETRARAQWQSLLGSVLRQLPDGVLIVDRDGRCMMANDQAERIAERFEPAGMAGMAGPATMLSLIGEPVRRAIAGRPFRDALLESASPEGRRVYTVSGAPLRDAAAELAAAVIVLDDITERTEASAALARALDQTRYLIENTPLAVIEWDADFVIRLWNWRAEELFGWSARDAIGQRIDALPVIHEDDAGIVAMTMGRLIDSATKYVKSTNRNRTRDGRTLTCEWYNSVLYKEHGEIDKVFSLVLDVSEREEAMEGLKEADRRKDVYIATLAHELRNPLAPIANAASLLRGKALPQERIEWIAAMVGRQTAQMARLLDDLLDVTRISRGKIELHRAPLELGRLVRDTLQTSMPLIEAGRHTVALELCDEPVWVEADALRLTQVLANLINNAAKYTPPEGRIEITLKERDSEAALWVRDNGIGIEPDMLARVFDPFVQVSSASHLAQGGLGIGLSLAKGLVELHEGRLDAHSDGPGHGSAFCVRLPAIAAPEAAEGVAPQAGSTAALGKTILVADDNVDAAESLAWLLRSEGATVEVAHDGAAALRLFNERPTDIAVLDLGMPEMDGLELAAILSRRSPRPFLVAVTGRGRQEDHAASLAAGFDAHLTKPVAPQQLIELLRGV
ncbi:ATP-binding protein [Massilia yuzhufengensis]|uniref:histidine kinase n=1 Tax=Massilia yuzhufengensis TaxID=1164594 RepID=A0A1I1E796_9BURK|nr:ATP-binding protein [Massilia yuzhufengensis]SFB82502.1 PAS domain S-box-containing protein [Massilia yuzhufengensis]